MKLSISASTRDDFLMCVFLLGSFYFSDFHFLAKAYEMCVVLAQEPHTEEEGEGKLTTYFRRRRRGWSCCVTENYLHISTRHTFLYLKHSLKLSRSLSVFHVRVKSSYSFTAHTLPPYILLVCERLVKAHIKHIPAYSTLQIHQFFRYNFARRQAKKQPTLAIWGSTYFPSFLSLAPNLFTHRLYYLPTQPCMTEQTARRLHSRTETSLWRQNFLCCMLLLALVLDIS